MLQSYVGTQCEVMRKLIVLPSKPQDHHIQ